MQNLALSPQGTRVALSVDDPNGLQGVWIYDFARRTMTRVTPAGVLAYRPTWASDGLRLAYSANESESSLVRSIWTLAVDRADPARVLVQSARHAQEISWPATGRVFAYRDGFDDATTLRDIYAATEGDSMKRPIVATAADEFNPAISPNGKWLAYTSNVSGRNEVYVTPFPDGGARYPVSTDGGTSPVWAHSSKQLFYRSEAARLMAVDMNGTAANPVGAQRALFDVARFTFDDKGKSFDVAPGDDRFLFIKPPQKASLTVVTNWWQEASQVLAKVKGAR
jgi:Tol biopolymer transport system component